MDSVVEIRNGNGKRHPKVSRRDFFSFFEGEIKKTAWNLWAKRCPTKTTPNPTPPITTHRLQAINSLVIRRPIFSEAIAY